MKRTRRDRHYQGGFNEEDVRRDLYEASQIPNGPPPPRLWEERLRETDKSAE